LLITHRDGEDPTKAMATDVSLATTHTVAQRVIDLLKLPISQDDLLKEYTVVSETDRVLQISAAGKTSDEATALAGAIAANAPFAVRATKAAIRRSVGLEARAAARAEAHDQAASLRMEDAREGMSALLAKRKPVFTGR